MSEEKVESFSIKGVISSIKFIPKALRLLREINKKYFNIIILLAILNGIIPIASLLSSQNLINSIQINYNGDFNNILKAFILVIICGLAQNIIVSIYSYYDSIYNQLIQNTLSQKIIKKANKLKLSSFEDSKVYDKISRAQEEVEYRPYATFKSIINLVTSLITLISTSIILVSWSRYSFLVLAIIPIISLYYMMKIGYLKFNIIYERTEKKRKIWYFNYVTTHDVSVKEIKLYNLGDYFLKSHKEICDEMFLQDKKISKKRLICDYIFSILSNGVNYIMIFFVVKEAFIGKILLGDATGLIKAIELFRDNSRQISETIFSMYDNMLYIKLIYEYFEMEEESEEADITESIGNNIESIEFKNVSFKYPNKKEYALYNVSFKINKGDVVALVGENGSGKSTLVKLITRLYEPTSGEIRINDKSVKKIAKKELRKNIGVVFQDYNKYEMTLKENIFFGDLEKKDNNKEILECCEMGQVNTFIDKLPKGLDSQLGLWFTDGSQLSGGQWQKISIARAFFRKSPVYILDEPSSALDPKAENELFNKLATLVNDKIGMFITHRFVNTSFANKIIVLDNGKLVEEGNQNELLQRKGRYYELYKIQNKERSVK